MRRNAARVDAAGDQLHGATAAPKNAAPGGRVPSASARAIRRMRRNAARVDAAGGRLHGVGTRTRPRRKGLAGGTGAGDLPPARTTMKTPRQTCLPRDVGRDQFPGMSLRTILTTNASVEGATLGRRRATAMTMNRSTIGSGGRDHLPVTTLRTSLTSNADGTASDLGRYPRTTTTTKPQRSVLRDGGRSRKSTATTRNSGMTSNPDGARLHTMSTTRKTSCHVVAGGALAPLRAMTTTMMA